MKRLVLIILADFIRLGHGGCGQVAQSHQEINENRRYHYENQYRTIIDSIVTTCDQVNFPVESSLKQYSCENCPHVLRIQSSNSTTVASSSFLDYSTSTSLFLENLEIEKLAPGAFNALQSLKNLHLSGNLITKIGIGIFNSLFNLEKLDLSKNRIEVLDPQCLAGILKLRFLNFSTNGLLHFDDLILDPNIHLLVSLDLSSNKISTFNPESTISKIENLNVSNNKLDKLYFCPVNSRSVDLSRNSIRSLEIQNCSNVNSELKKFDLSYNDISDLNSDMFGAPGLVRLEELSLHHNNISLLPTGFFSNLHNLENLNLSYNKIHQFRHGIFESLRSLKVLDLSHNNLTDIKRYLHNLVVLSELHLSHNDLLSLNSKQLVDDLPNLSFISIDRNNLSCDNLINIIHDFRKLNITIEYGNARNSTNIHGISCLDNENLNSKFEEIIMNKLDQMSNQDFKKSAMYEYFNKDFKNSNFYEYMQNLQKFNDLKFNETQIFNYFNKDFENTKFFKYLESMKDSEKFNIQFNKSVYNYFNNDFKNSSFVKYLDDLKGAEDILNGGFSKSNMYKFFNIDFENTHFYKYLESLRRNSFGSNLNGTQYEKLTDDGYSYHDSENRAILILIFISLVLILIILVFQTLIYLKKATKKFLKNEQVELIDA